MSDVVGKDEISATIDLKQFRNALGAFATGVTIITTSDSGADVGLTANSFNSVSLNPPMVLWSLGKSSLSLPIFERTSHFAVHILAEDQEDLSTRFATRGGEKFKDLELERGENGLPLLSGCSARFQCRKVFAYEGGDHIIFVGEVLAFDHTPQRPLLFHGGSYAVTAPREPSVESSDEDQESLSYLITRANIALRGASLRYAEELGLSLPERSLLGVLLHSHRLSIDEVNDVIGYTGSRVSEQAVKDLAQRGLITILGGHNEADDTAVLALTAAGRDCAVRMIALTRAQNAEAEIQLGPQAILLKQLLGQLIQSSESSQDKRVHRHMEVMKNMEIVAQ